MTKMQVIVTGVGYKLINNTVNDSVQNIFDNINVKPNIGACVVKELVSSGIDVFMISKTKTKLENIKESLTTTESNIELAEADLLNQDSVENVLNKLSNNKQIHLIHCAGLSAGSYALPDDNPYLSIEQTPVELPLLEYGVVVKSLLILVKLLLPKFNLQNDTRVVVVSSMSGIRSVPFGYSHAAAKGGLHQAVRSLALELNKRNIYVSEVMPGMVDTGMYDPTPVQESIIKMGQYFGYEYKKNEIPQMPPSEVAKAVKMCLLSDAHILTINMVSKGQWPNLSS